MPNSVYPENFFRIFVSGFIEGFLRFIASSWYLWIIVIALAILSKKLAKSKR